MAQGHPVQVVSVRTDGNKTTSFKLHEAALREVLLQDNVKDLPMVVVSVAGKMRQGKSFLLNFVIRYLKNRGLGDWMGDVDVPPEGFEWRSGSTGCTMGILVWSEVFVVEGPRGKKLAVLLMDTQGTFDTNTTMTECSTVFALSTMLSSIQIYNLMQDIKRDDLDSLQLFVEYGKAAQNEGYGNKQFKNLMFLVRDWQWPEDYQYGDQGGKEFIMKKLENRADIRSCFEDVSCFLLIYPWNMIDGRPSGISDRFKTFLKHFLSNTLQWNRLEMMVKDINGEQLTAKDVLTHFKAFVAIFQEGKLPTPQSALEANIHVALTKAHELGLKTFDALIMALTDDIADGSTPSQDATNLNNTLLHCQEEAVLEFLSRATLGANFEKSDQYLQKLNQDIGAKIRTLVEQNTGKKKTEEAERKINAAEEKSKEALKMADEQQKRRIEVEKELEETKKKREEAERKKIEAEKNAGKIKETLKKVEETSELKLKTANNKFKKIVEEMKLAEKVRQDAVRVENEAKVTIEQQKTQQEMIKTIGAVAMIVLPHMIAAYAPKPAAAQSSTTATTTDKRVSIYSKEDDAPATSSGSSTNATASSNPVVELIKQTR